MTQAEFQAQSKEAMETLKTYTKKELLVWVETMYDSFGGLLGLLNEQVEENNLLKENMTKVKNGLDKIINK